MIPAIYKITVSKPEDNGSDAGFIFSGRPFTLAEKRGRARWERMISALQTVGFINLISAISTDNHLQFMAVVDHGEPSLDGIRDDMSGEALIKKLIADALAAPETSLNSTPTSTDVLTIPRLFTPQLAFGAVEASEMSNIVFGTTPPLAPLPPVIEPEVGLAGRPVSLVYDSVLEGEVTLGGMFPDIRDHVFPVSDEPRTISNISQMLGQVFSINPTVASYEYTNLWIESQFFIIPSNPTTGLFSYDKVTDAVEFTVPDTFGAAFGASVHALVNVKYSDGREAVVYQQITAYGSGMPAEFADYAQFISIVPSEGSDFIMIGEDSDFPLYDSYDYGVHMFDEDHEFVVVQTRGPFQYDLAQSQRYSFDNGGLEFNFSTDIDLKGATLSPQGFITGDYIGESEGPVTGTVTITLKDYVFTYPITYTIA